MIKGGKYQGKETRIDKEQQRKVAIIALKNRL
jgi:hypothetical protein